MSFKRFEIRILVILGTVGRVFGFIYLPPVPDNFTFEDTYDFIIVGSGATGSVIANRLSEHPEWKILLLEAGEPGNLISDVPMLAAFLQYTNYNWGFRTEPQNGSCLGLVDGRCPWPRGKALGGSSVINYMIYTRGHPLDYDRWAARGNPGWSYQEVFPYFLKSEDENLAVKDPEYHRKGGYLSVEDVQVQSKIVDSFIEASQQLGYDYVDYNGRNTLGVSYIQTTTKRGRRHSADSAFLKPIRHRTNLHISTSSRVLKLLIDSNKHVYGVEFAKHRRLHRIRTSKEVIVSGGTFMSPQLLMLSGIGPRDHLEELGINVIVDADVGKNLHDHLTYAGLAFVLNETVSLDQDKAITPESAIMWLLEGKGLLSTIGGIEAISFIKTGMHSDPDPIPDIELLFVGGSLATDKGLLYHKSLGIPVETYDKLFKPVHFNHTWSVFPVLLHPKSIGYLKLKSKNPFHWPLFYPNYLTDPDSYDVDAFVAAINEVIRISKTPTMQRYGSVLYDAPVPGCESFAFGSDDYWRCAVRQLATTIHHQAGTCKMGSPDDPSAVVDPTLKVYGVTGLRVADTSVIPFALSAHTNAPAYMIGEKASDMIKQEWGANTAR